MQITPPFFAPYRQKKEDFFMSEKKVGKRLLTWVLALVMTLSLLPLNVLAAETDGQPNSFVEKTDGAVNIKKSVSKDGSELTLEAWVTDEMSTMQTYVPMDIVLVLDVSGSMDDPTESYDYQKTKETEWASSDIYWASETYYAKLDDEYYRVSYKRTHVDGHWDNYQWIPGYDQYWLEANGQPIGKVVSGFWDTSYSGVLYTYSKVTGTQTKLQAMQKAVNSFIDSVAAKKDGDKAVDHKIGIVKFSGEKSDSTGNTTYTESGLFYTHTYNHTQVLEKLTEVTTGAEQLKSSVNSLTAAGCTSADYGMEKAAELLNKRNGDAAKRPAVVIMFTDGEPNRDSGYDKAVAGAAVKAAKGLKDKGIKVYTIGMFGDANQSDTNNKFNQYMHGVSSNYPNAVNDKNSSSGVNLGTRASGNYYFAAANAGELDKIFQSIGQEVSSLKLDVGTDTVLSDTLSSYFELNAPEGAENSGITVMMANIANDGNSWENATDASGVKVAITGGKTIKVTGFDYKANAVTKHTDGTYTGAKLIITIPIKPNPDAAWEAGTKNYPTNETTGDKQAGLIYKDETGREAKTLLDESPTVQQTAYTVEFKTDGNGTLSGTTTYTVLAGTKWDDKITAPPTPQAKNDDFTFDQWSPALPTDNPSIDSNLIYTATFKSAKASYKVEHYLQNLDNDEYTLKDTEANLSGTIDTQVTAEPKTTYTGFTYSDEASTDTKSGIVMEDGELTLKLYYTRNTHQVIYKITGSYFANEAYAKQENIKYGAPLTLISDDMAQSGYEWRGWSSLPETMPDEDVTVTGSYTAADGTDYTVEHYLENLNGGFTLEETESLKAKTDEAVTATEKSYTGFTFDKTVEGTVQSGTVDAGGSLVLKLYYTRNSYKVTYSYDGTAPDDATPSLPEEASFKYGASVTVADLPTSETHDFNGWNTSDAEISSNQFTMPAKDVALTGHWTTKEIEPTTVTVNFKIVGGTWNDDDTIPKSVEVTLTNGEGSLANVTIPTGKPDDKHEGTGTWSNNAEISGDPSPDTVITQNTTFTLTFDAKETEPPTPGTIQLGEFISKNFESRYGASTEETFRAYATVTPYFVNASEQPAEPEQSTAPEQPGQSEQQPATPSETPEPEVIEVSDNLTLDDGPYEYEGSVTLKAGYSKQFTFEEISLRAGTYRVEVYERDDGKDNIVYDDTTYSFTLTVVEKDGGTVASASNFKSCAEDSNEWISMDSAEKVEFTNVYTYRRPHHPRPKPTVEIEDDDALGLNTTDHFAYIVGYGNGEVRPQNNITRAEVATIFFRLLTDDVRDENLTKTNRYSDVTRADWYNTAVSTLSSMGIITGYPDGTFRPNAAITRAEFAAIAARFDSNGDKTTAKFSDIANHWAKDEISIAYNNGWINGYPNGTFGPQRDITRAETMTLVNRVLNRLPETEEDLLPNMVTWTDNADKNAWYYLAVQEATNSHYYKFKTNSKYEKWTELRETRDWTQLEK